MAVVLCILVLVGLAIVMAAGIARRAPGWGDSAWPELDAPEWWEDEGGDGLGGVREPRRPVPSGGSAAATAEPDERAA